MTATYITKLSLVNFKGMTRDLTFRPITIICGDNETGKTGVGSDAVRIGLLGHSPRHGNKPHLTFGFAGAENGATTMQVGIQLSDNRSANHMFELRGKSVSYSKLGALAIPAVPPVLLDTREYLRKSGPDKIRYVFSQVDLAALGFTTEKVTARLKADVKVDQPTEDSERALNELVDEITLLGEQRDEGKQTHQEWMENVAAHIKNQKESAAAVLEDMEGTIQGLTQLRTQDARPAPESVRIKLDALRMAHQEAVVARQRLQDQQAAYDKAVNARAFAKRQFAGGNDRSEELARLEKEHAALTEKLDSFKSKTAALLEKKNPIDVEIGELNAEAKHLNDQANELEEETESQLKQSCCPTCKSKGAGWKKSLKAASAKRLKELRKESSDAIAKVDLLTKQAQALAAEVVKSRQADSTITEERAHAYRLTKQIADLRAHQETYTDQKAKLDATAVLPEPVAQAAIDQARADVDVIHKQILALEDEDRQATAAIQDAKRAAQAQRNYEIKQAEVEVLKLAQKVILELQKEMTALAFGTFIEKVNLFCAGILRDDVKLEYRDGDVGYFRGATWVGLDYFSGIEELTSFAGLSVALCQQSPIKLVVMDEMGRLTERRKAAIVNRMAELIEKGIIDQFVGIDVSKSAYEKIHGIEFIEVK
jgi:hypothetical protein